MAASRRQFLGMAAASAAGFAFAPRLLAAAPAAELYARSVAIDGLGGPGGRSGEKNAPLTEAEVADVAASGLSAVNLTIGDIGTMTPLAAFERLVRDIARWEGEIDRHPEVLARIRTVADIEQAMRGGRTGLIYGLQDGVSFEDELGRLDALRQLGVRVIQPTYNRRNLLGDGCMEPADAGLSRAGHEAVERMNELGLLVDLSHCGRRTAADAMATSRRPLAFTHTGCAALVDHPRHRTDEELRRIAAGGGIVGIFVMPYLAKGRQPTAADVVAHLEHAIGVAGEDHVGIGTDGYISATEVTPEFADQFRQGTRRRRELGIAAPYETEEGYLFAGDLNRPRRFETLAGLLLERGHRGGRIEKILGGNFLRVFRDTWTPTTKAAG